MSRNGSQLITPVILSGGSGERLWPLSRADKPKQLLALLGERSMLQMTALRVASPRQFKAPILVGRASQAEIMQEQLSKISGKPMLSILEPFGRNTAAAVALAALEAPKGSLLLVLPSDHLILSTERFEAAVAGASAAAAEGWLVTFGIRAERPETGYGYIRRGEAINHWAFRAEAFVEKPDRATALEYLADGRFDWNAGIFMFRADTIIDALGKYAPDVLHSVRASLERVSRTGNCLMPDPDIFQSVPSISIDNAVMERANNVAVVPVDIGWSDVGSWDALYDVGEKDQNGNSVQGSAIPVETRGCLLRSEGPLLVTEGVEDLIIVATKDVVMVIRRGNSQKVRELLELVEGQN